MGGYTYSPDEDARLNRILAAKRRKLRKMLGLAPLKNRKRRAEEWTEMIRKTWPDDPRLPENGGVRLRLR